MTHHHDPQFEELLGHLKETRGFDFTGYKRSSLMRRVDRRMTQVAVSSYAKYLDYLELHPDEFTALFNTILINVTAFFRDPEAWEFLRAEVLGPLIAGRPADAPIRVWSAGCASGEEAYTLAIVLAEALGLAEFRRRVKIYATDVDADGLAEARQAAYCEQKLAGMPPELVARYFEAANGRHVFRSDLRRSVIFGRNDLVQDAPVSRIDLLVCRNTLLYFNAETQARVLERFHFALAREGVLLLGKAEMLLNHANIFAPVDPKRRVFRKVPRSLPGDGAALMQPAAPAAPRPAADLDNLRGEAFLANPVAQVVVTSGGLVALANRRAESLFGMSSRDIGRPFRDLDLSFQPVQLRRYVERVQAERRPARVTDVEYLHAGEVTHLEIQLSPLVDGDSGLLGVSLVFHDVTTARRLADKLQHANRQLERAYEELRSTNEELETTNEELQSTVEVLETTNEELQSTNEELESMNQELQSTNDEIQLMNDLLHDRTGELAEVNAFLAHILTSLRAGVAVVNRDLRIQVWNRRAEDMWGLPSAETVGEHLLDLDIGLPTERLRPLLRQALSGGRTPLEARLSAVNRRGRTICVRVVCTPLVVDGEQPLGAILVMEPEDAAAGPAAP